MNNVLVSQLNLLKMLFIRDFKALYVQNLLGLAWVVLNPLFVVLLYSFVFSVILKIRSQGFDEDYSYAIFLLAGLIPYLTINDVIQSAASCLTQKKDLIVKAVFPAALLPVNCVLISIVSELITLIIILSLAVYEGDGEYKLLWLCLPLIVVFRLMFSMAIAWWVSVLSVFIPDIRQVLNALLPAWMFLTPILYSKQQAPEYFQALQYLNPLAYIVDAYRAIILQGQWPDFNLYLCFIVLAVLNIIGYWVFKSLLPRAKDFL